jgi:hypothetical protein
MGYAGIGRFTGKKNTATIPGNPATRENENAAEKATRRSGDT